MKFHSSFFIIALFLLMIAACTNTNQVEDFTTRTAAPSVPAKSSSNVGTYFTIKEVGLGPNGYVSLTNFTDVPASLAGLYLCQASDCFELPEVVVGAGETVRVASGDGSGIEAVVATEATFGELRPTDGEIALYSSRTLDDPQEMVIYFQWGSTPHDLTQTAIDAGLWVQGGYGPSSQNATRLFKVEESGLWLFVEP